MSVYLLLISTGILFVILTRLRPDTQYVTSATFLVMLIVVGAFRYRVGMDYPAYVDIYDIVARYGPGIYSNVEFGFCCLCYLCSLVGGTPQLMFAVMVTLTLVLIYRGLYYFSDDIMLSMLIFLCIGQLYLNCFNAMRQMLAVGLIFVGFTYLAKKKLIPYLLLIFAASTFHSSAIIMVPLYWLLDRRYNKMYVLLALGAIGISSRFLLTIVLNSGYGAYLGMETYTTMATFVNVLYLALSVVIFIFSDYLMPGYRYRNIFINLNTLAMVCFGMYLVFSGTPMMIVITRVTYYLMIAYAVILPAVLAHLDGRILQLSYLTAVVGVLSFLFIRSTIIKGWEYNLTPFRFNFNLF